MKALISRLEGTLSPSEVRSLPFARSPHRWRGGVRAMRDGGLLWSLRLKVPPRNDVYAGFVFRTWGPGEYARLMRVTTHLGAYQLQKHPLMGVPLMRAANHPGYNPLVDVLRVDATRVMHSWLEPMDRSTATALMAMGPPEVVSRPLLSPSSRRWRRAVTERRACDHIRAIVSRVRRRKAQAATPEEVAALRGVIREDGWAVRSTYRGWLPEGVSWDDAHARGVQ